jgi:hypothetical protein
LATIACVTLQAASAAPELWYFQHSYVNSPAGVQYCEGLIDQAAAAGYTGVVMWDTGINVLQYSWWNASYMQQVVQHAQSKGLKVMPLVAPYGHSTDILRRNPNWAEGEQVVGTQLQVEASGKTLQVVNSLPTLANSSFESGKTGWFAYADAGTVVDSSTAHTGLSSGLISGALNASGNARFYQSFAVHPWRQYHLRMYLKTQNFQGYTQMEVFGDNDFTYNRVNLPLNVATNQDWTAWDVAFNSGNHTNMSILTGVWGGNQGSLWFDDITVEETALVYVLRGTSTPLKMYDPANSAHVYTENTDYGAIADPKFATNPSFDDYWHAPMTIPVPAGSTLKPGQTVSMDWYAVQPIYGDAGVSLTDPGAWQWMQDNAKAVGQAFPNAGGFFLGYDEMRHMNSTASAKAKNMTAGQLLAWNFKQTYDLYKSVNPNVPLYVWSDMFDPNHNAVNNYYLVQGDLTGSWLGVPSDVTIMNWNLFSLTTSATWFSGKNSQQPVPYRQIVAGYYDTGDGAAAANSEISQVQGIPGIAGFMYTTFGDDYSQLAPFASAVKAGWSTLSTPPVPDFTLAVTPTSQGVYAGAQGSYTATVAAVHGFAGVVTFSVTGLPAGAVAAFNPASTTTAGSSALTITVPSSTPAGTYPLSVTGTSGTLHHSVAINMTVSVAPRSGTAKFSKLDTVTQGNWKTVYGGDGYAIPNDSTSYPAYAQVTVANTNTYTWLSSTTDVRAPQRGTATGRIASQWYSNTFTIDLNLTDQLTHQVGLYALDFDNSNRSETIDVLDGVSGVLLDTRTVTAYTQGQHLVWNATGHVRFRITKTGGNNATLSALFFGPAALAPAPDYSIGTTPSTSSVTAGASATFTTTVSSVNGFAAAVTLSTTGAPAGTMLSFSPTQVAGSGSSVLTLTTLASLPAGTYPLTITGTSGSLSHSANVSLMVTNPIAISSNAATFLKLDSTTQGNWKSAYGADGYAIPNDVTSYPTYAQVTMTAPNTYTWTGTTTDVRATQRGVAAGRIAAQWYSNTFTIDVNLTDKSTHQVSLYALDFDYGNRAETIDVLDGSTGTLLDTRSVSAYSQGQYLAWNLTGHIRFRITMTSGNNATISGMFFGTAPSASPDFAVTASPSSQTVVGGTQTTFTATVAALNGFSGTVALGLAGLPAGASASFNPASVSSAGSSSLTVTSGTSTLAGTYPLTITGLSGLVSHAANATLTVTAPTNLGTTASFLKLDTTTQGTWKTVYGLDGYAIPNDATSYPAYAQVSMASPNTYTWASPTGDLRATQSGLTASRIATQWYSNTFLIDVNLSDGKAHQLALYCLDFDFSNRAERIDVLDAVSGSLLDTRTVSAYTGGQYLVWNVSGHVQLRVTMTAGNNATVSGLFLR